MSTQTMKVEHQMHRLALGSGRHLDLYLGDRRPVFRAHFGVHPGLAAFIPISGGEAAMAAFAKS